MKKGIAKLSLFFLAAGMVFGNASAAVSADEAAAGENGGAQSPAGTIGFVDLEDILGILGAFNLIQILIIEIPARGYSEEP